MVSISDFLLMIILLLVTASPLMLLLLFTKQKKKAVEPKTLLPPGPRRLPLIGNLHQLGDLPHRSIQRLSKEYGPIMFLQLGSVPTIVISSADVVRDISRSHDVIFSGRPDLYVAKKLSYNCNNISFAPYGDAWRDVRKIAILELLSSKRVQSFQAVRDEEVALMVDVLAGSSGPVNLNKLSLLLVNNIVCRVTFGKKYGNGGDNSTSRFDQVLHETQSLLGEFIISDYFPWMRWLNRLNGFEAKVQKVFEELDKLYDEVIQDHLDPNRWPKPDHEDIVDVLLRIQKDPSQGFALRNHQIKGVLTDLFIAGTDTSASTLVWTMTELIKNPSVMRRAQEEVREVAKGKGKVEESDLPRLTYMKSVIKETFRLHPPVPLLVPRETTEDCMVGRYKIPAKTRVFIDARSIGKDTKRWENPNEFLPDRFLDSSIDFRGQHFELIPFGIGRRGCPGTGFAVVLLELALANMLYRFDWKLPDGMSEEEVSMEEVFGITMFKKTPLSLVASPVDV